MKIENGTVRINAGYTLKLPSRDVTYASEDTHLGASIEFALDDDVEFEALADQIIDLEAQLAAEVKLAVFAQMGVQPTEIGDNILAPDLSDFKPAEKGSSKGKGGRSQGRTGNRSGNGRGGKSNGGSRSSRTNGGSNRSAGRPAKQTSTDRSELPIVTLEGDIGWQGEYLEATEFYDQRPLKRNGDFSPRAADFQQVDGKLSVWITDRDGFANDIVLDALDDAGVEYDVDEFVS